ncbi:hypothetical protein BsWGS_26859 [Bradybaena similaris]
MNETTVSRNITFSKPPTPTAELAMLTVLLATLSVTLVTNIITIFLIMKTKALRTTTNYFVVSLSSSDAMYGAFTLGLIGIVVIHNFIDFYYNVRLLRAILFFSWGTLIHSSIANLSLVSIERWIYITRPFWYQRHVTVKVVIISIVITWVTAMTVNFPYLFPNFGSRIPAYFKACHGYVYPVLHTACCLLLFLIYTHIAVITYQQINKISKLKPQIQKPDNDSTAVVKISKRPFQSENWKAIKLLITICGLYVVFTSPYVYYFSYTQLNPLKAAKLYSLSTPLLILLSFYHCSNFFVYSLRMRQFRRAFKKCFGKCIFCRGSKVDSVSTVERTTSIYELQSHTRRWTYVEDVSTRKTSC